MPPPPPQTPHPSPNSPFADLPPLSVQPGPALAKPLPPDRPVRWGFLATGKIARGFAQNLALLPDAELTAVGARSLESAQAFAAEYGVGTAYGDYASLVNDPDVDVVYVATPHALHKEHVMLAFDAGKPVLCEKALTLHAADAAELVAVSRERGLFLMEAMWTRCIPLVRRLQQAIGTGAFGKVTQVRADLGFPVDRPPTDRLLDPTLGGGALLDMGVYPLTLAHLFLGEPARVAAAATLSDQGVDLDVALALAYDGGGVSSLTASMTALTPRTASIATELGRFDLPESFHHPTTATWTGAGGSWTLHEPLIGSGLAHEAIEVMRCLRAGEIESPLVPLDDSVALLRLTDRVRAQIGVRYPGEPV